LILVRQATVHLPITLELLSNVEEWRLAFPCPAQDERSPCGETDEPLYLLFRFLAVDEQSSLQEEVSKRVSLTSSGSSVRRPFSAQMSLRIRQIVC
jgi:hypothetical protein